MTDFNTTSELLAFCFENLDYGDGMYARELYEVVKRCECKAFSLAAAVYWVCNDYHSGQGSNGYRHLSFGTSYVPGCDESSEELRLEDYEVDAIYTVLEKLHSWGALSL